MKRLLDDGISCRVCGEGRANDTAENRRCGRAALLLEEVTQTLEALPLGGMHRTVNGDLLYTGGRGQVKYRMTCTGTVPATPGLDGLHRGDVMTVHCLQQLWQETLKESSVLSRPAVPGTVLVLDAKRQAVDFDIEADQTLRLKDRREEGPVYVSYCPLLKIRLTEMKLNTANWGAAQGWMLAGEEG